MIYLYLLPLSSDNQTAFANLAPREAILIPSADFIAGSVGFKDPAGLLLPNTYPWQSQILILTKEMFLAQVITRKDVTPEPKDTKQQIKSQLNVIGCIYYLATASMLLVIEAVGYFPSGPSATMATCPLVLYLDSCLWPWLPGGDRHL